MFFSIWKRILVGETTEKFMNMGLFDPYMVQRQSPTLRTVRMVEKTLRDGESLVTVAQLKRALPRKVHHAALLDILDYLQEKKQIYWSPKGITWLEEASPALRRIIAEGYRM